MSNCQSVSKQTLSRLPVYLNYLKSNKNVRNTSSAAIADALGLNQVQVRKDLALVSSGGKPKTGYNTSELIADISRFLGYDNVNSAVIVGAGHLGKALMSFKGFRDYGLEIVAGFDTDESLLSREIDGKNIFHLSKLRELCERLKIRIGIITVPVESAQSVCDLLVESGILAIWNFAPTILSVPECILVQNENMAASLAVLSNHLKEKLQNGCS